MDNQNLAKFQKIVKKVVQTELKPIKKTLDEHGRKLDEHGRKLDEHGRKLDEHGRKLDALWDQTVHLTEETVEVHDTLDAHTVVLKRIEEKVEHNSDNINRLDKRIKPIEDRFGIVPPPEFTIIR